MATDSEGKPGNRKRRNNARRSAARKMQQQNPGLRYHKAMDSIAAGGDKSAPAPLLQDYLGLRTAQDIANHYRNIGCADPSLRVPIGVNANGPLHLDLEQGLRNGTGPHTFIFGGTSAARLSAAATICTALRANNPQSALEVTWAGHATNSNEISADQMFCGIDAFGEFQEWLHEDLIRRQYFVLERSVHAADSLSPGELVRRIVVIDLPSVTGSQLVDKSIFDLWWSACKELLMKGRSLGVHLICCTPDLENADLQKSVILHIRHIIALQQSAAAAQLPAAFAGEFAALDALGPREAHLILRGVELQQVPFTLFAAGDAFVEVVNIARGASAS